MAKVCKRPVDVTNIREIGTITIVEGFLMPNRNVYTQILTVLQPVQLKMEVDSTLNQNKEPW